MVDFKKLLEDAPRTRQRRETEAERLREDPGPPLEATPVDGMQDWTRKIGVLYGTPVELHDGWGVNIYPTRQQNALLDKARREQEATTGAYDESYMNGRAAVSIDKSGRVRTLMIRDASRGWRYDMYGNISIACTTCAREPSRTNPRTGTRHQSETAAGDGDKAQAGTRQLMQDHAGAPLRADGGPEGQSPGHRPSRTRCARRRNSRTERRPTATACAELPDQATKAETENEADAGNTRHVIATRGISAAPGPKRDQLTLGRNARETIGNRRAKGSRSMKAMNLKAWNDWIDREEARRRLEDDPPANTGLLAEEHFEDEYAHGTGTTTRTTGSESGTIRSLLAGACAGWRTKPDSKEFYEAMRAKKPSKRQTTIAAVLIMEGSLNDVLLAYQEGAFTWRQLARAMHRAGRYSGQLARYVNLHKMAR